MSDQRISDLEKILAGLDPVEREAVVRALQEEQQGKRETEDYLAEVIYEHPICPIDEYVFGKQYLGLPPKAVYPNIMDLIVAADDPKIREVFAILGKGSGKSTFSSILMTRGVYRLMAYRDPAAYFGVLPDVNLGIVNMSISKDQAEAVIFDKFWSLVKNSPIFNPRNKPIYEKTKRHIAFPKNIHALSGHSGYRAYFGYDVYIGTLDECDWYKDTDDHPVSEEIYAAIQKSCITRFPNDYKLFCITTPQAEDGFMWPKLVEARVRGTPVVFGSGDTDSDVKVTVS